MYRNRTYTTYIYSIYVFNIFVHRGVIIKVGPDARSVRVHRNESKYSGRVHVHLFWEKTLAAEKCRMHSRWHRTYARDSNSWILFDIFQTPLIAERLGWGTFLVQSYSDAGCSDKFHTDCSISFSDTVYNTRMYKSNRKKFSQSNNSMVNQPDISFPKSSSCYDRKSQILIRFFPVVIICLFYLWAFTIRYRKHLVLFVVCICRFLLYQDVKSASRYALILIFCEGDDRLYLLGQGKSYFF